MNDKDTYLLAEAYSKITEGNIHNLPTKPVQLSASEIANAQTDRTGRQWTIVRRPDKLKGGFWVAAVNVDDGSVMWHDRVNTKEEVSAAIKMLNRDMDKFTGRGDGMGGASRHRNKLQQR